LTLHSCSSDLLLLQLLVPAAGGRLFVANVRQFGGAVQDVRPMIAGDVVCTGAFLHMFRLLLFLLLTA